MIATAVVREQTWAVVPSLGGNPGGFPNSRVGLDSGLRLPRAQAGRNGEAGGWTTRHATPAGPRLPGSTSTGVGISHSCPLLLAPRTRPSRANWRIRRSDMPNWAAACLVVTFMTSSAGISDTRSNSVGLGCLSVHHLVNQKPDDLAVVIQSLEDAVIVGRREVALPVSHRPQACRPRRRTRPTLFYLPCSISY